MNDSVRADQHLMQSKISYALHQLAQKQAYYTGWDLWDACDDAAMMDLAEDLEQWYKDRHPEYEIPENPF